MHLVITAALQQGVADKGLGDDAAAALKFIRGLKAQGEVDSLLRTEAVLGGLSDLLWAAIVILQSAGAATGEEIQSKFSGAVELSYAGLDAFFGGMEGIIGAPHPKLFEMMKAEHTERSDSNQKFTTG